MRKTKTKKPALARIKKQIVGELLDFLREKPTPEELLTAPTKIITARMAWLEDLRSGIGSALAKSRKWGDLETDMQELEEQLGAEELRVSHRGNIWSFADTVLSRLNSIDASIRDLTERLGLGDTAPCGCPHYFVVSVCNTPKNRSLAQKYVEEASALEVQSRASNPEVLHVLFKATDQRYARSLRHRAGGGAMEFVTLGEHEGEHDGSGDVPLEQMQ